MTTLLSHRQTVWKEMVERERRKGDVRVENARDRHRSWWDKLRAPLALFVSIAVFIVLLGVASLSYKWQIMHIGVRGMRSHYLIVRDPFV